MLFENFGQWLHVTIEYQREASGIDGLNVLHKESIECNQSPEPRSRHLSWRD